MVDAEALRASGFKNRKGSTPFPGTMANSCDSGFSIPRVANESRPRHANFSVETILCIF